MRARVKIVGIPQPLGATLTKISILADNRQRFWADVKEFPVDLTLDQTPPGLRPGMSAQAELFVDLVTNANPVPLTALYSAGQESFIFVRDGEQITPRKVRIGRTNETLAELMGDAVKPGEQVLMLQIGQGQELLDKAGIKVTPTSQPSDGEFTRRRRDVGSGESAPSGDQQTPPADGQRQRRRRNAEGGEGGGGGGPGGGGAPPPAPVPGQ
jgi:hypothetical protein